MNNSQEADFTIIGAGLSGTLLSIMLAKLDFNVALFESRPDMRKTNISAGRSINLALSSRGIQALNAVNLYEKLEPQLVPMFGRELHLEDKKFQYQSYSKSGKDAIYSVSRANLNKLLLDSAEATGKVNISFDTSCEEVDIDTKTIKFSNKNHHQYKICIGTDGFNSQVRTSICSPDDVSIEQLGHQYKELTLPALNNNFQIKQNALHIWPRGEYMLIALPNNDGSFTVTLFMPSKGEYSFAQLTDSQAVNKFFTKKFPDAAELIPNISEQFFTNPTGTLATIRTKQWYKNKTLILGDAAHAVVPFHGQGMNCAFEDCLCLYQLLKNKPNFEINDLFAKLVQLRKDNANAIADMALENYIEMRNQVRSHKFHLKKELAWQLESRFPGLFVPRYSMVMFQEIPYKTAQILGEIQNDILDKLTENITSLEEVDYCSAEKLIKTRLHKFRNHYGQQDYCI